MKNNSSHTGRVAQPVSRFPFHVLTILALSTLSPQLSTFAQGTAFTYQGRLQNNGNPANGSYDLTFALFNALSGPGQVGSSLTNTATAVSNGLFTVTMDFGPGVFSGTNYWLDVAVRTNGAGAFVELTPRQPLTPAPYAIYAESVTASGIVGTLLDAQLAHSAVTVNPGPGLSGGGRVGLGNTIILTNSGVLSVTGNADITASTVSGAVTLGDTATSTDTANTLVKRDGSGNFSAASITLGGALTLPDVTLGGPDIIYSGPGLLLYGDNNGNFFGGNGAGSLVPISFYNTAIGYQAFAANTSGYQNTANGYQALYSNTSGTYNTASGSVALFSNTNGTENTASGAGALYSNTSGSGNTATGSAALRSNTSGYENTANGFGALYLNTSGYNNTANGEGTLNFNSSGYENTANGIQALFSNTNGYDNTADGAFALQNLITGNNNIALGYEAGFNITTGSDNIDVGNAGVSTDDNIIRIGSGQAQTFIAGVIKGNGGGLTNLTTATTANYVHSYSSTTQAVATAGTFQDITNNVDVQISGWTHIANSTSFTSGQAGLYLVQYTAEATTTASAASSVSLKAVVNGTEIADSQSTASADTASLVSSISKSFIAGFGSGDILKFQLTGSSTTDRIVSNTGNGATRPSFSCTIIRIQ